MKIKIPEGKMQETKYNFEEKDKENKKIMKETQFEFVLNKSIFS